jgi:hypothetical protein
MTISSRICRAYTSIDRSAFLWRISQRQFRISSFSSSTLTTRTTQPFSAFVSEALAEVAEAARLNSIEKSKKTPKQPIHYDLEFLRSLLPEEKLNKKNESGTPGHILAILNQVGKGGYKNGAIITDEQIRWLISTMRANFKKDAKVLLSALTNTKRINRFLLSPELASECLEALLKSNPKEGGLLFLEHFNPKSGLMFSARTSDYNKALEHVLLHLNDIKPSTATEEENQAVKDNDLEELKDDDISTDDSNTESKDDDNNQTKSDESTPKVTNRPWNALVQSHKWLIYRHSRPERKMKKRAARAYAFQSKCHEGPNEDTFQLWMSVGSKVSTMDAVYQDLILPCEAAWCQLPDHISLELKDFRERTQSHEVESE